MLDRAPAGVGGNAAGGFQRRAVPQQATAPAAAPIQVVPTSATADANDEIRIEDIPF
jgi:hypothetical protein